MKSQACYDTDAIYTKGDPDLISAPKEVSAPQSRGLTTAYRCLYLPQYLLHLLTLSSYDKLFCLCIEVL
jgi:hypothetical protein